MDTPPSRRPLTSPRVSHPPLSVKSFTTDEPMQIGLVRGHLPPEELARRKSNQLCLYCGKPNHTIRDCPSKNGPRNGKKENTSTNNFLNFSSLHLSILLSLQWNDHPVSVSAMVDSGASSCFMDFTLATSLGIPYVNKKSPLSIQCVDGSPLTSGPVVLETIPLLVRIGNEHKEFLQFDLVTSPLFPVILGISWLRTHDPVISWTSGTFSFTSKHCVKFCLRPSVTRGCISSILDKEIKSSDVSLPQEYAEFSDVFNKKGVECLPPHRKYDCPIELLPGANIPFGHIYPLAEPVLHVLKEYIRENLEKGFIRRSASPAGAGIFFVEKKDSGLRPCVDYRELNKITIKNKYPLPLIPGLLEQLKNAIVFTKLDLRGAYNLLRIPKDDEWKTAFRTRYGHYEYTVMPYGLCNAPAAFQHLANDILRDLLDVYVVMYLDDILIYSTSLDLHRSHVKSVLSRLCCHHLYVKFEKCVFEATRIEFLGFIITPGQMEMDPRKIEAITNWPIPQTKKEMQRFLGFANFYRKFIRNFSKIVFPLTQLTRKKNPFLWSNTAQQAFDKLREHSPNRQKSPPQKFTVPPAQRTTVLQLCHDAPKAGHEGINKTLDLVQRHYWWPSVVTDVRDYVRSCSICTRSKVPRTKMAGLLQPLPIPHPPWASISVDFIVKLPHLRNTIPSWSWLIDCPKWPILSPLEDYHRPKPQLTSFFTISLKLWHARLRYL
uniref:Gypsy retrotransposon integrase-like protein 1 n=1 Tax=Leptobrachium leishanense TaxID=445787 RepID=A0A8C5M7Z7_9ANUR